MTIQAAAARKTVKDRPGKNGHKPGCTFEAELEKIVAGDEELLGERMLPPGKIVESPLQIRKHYDPVKHAELVESVRSLGIKHALIVRPLPGDKYELVDGHRRLRAGREAKLSAVRCDVRRLTDREVIEIMLTTARQREDLDDMDQARAMRRLVEEHEATPAGLAKQLGASLSSVRDLLKLCDAPPRLQTALAAGEITRSVAVLIARIPSPKLREQAGDELLKQARRGQDVSVRWAKDWVERTYMRELKGAVFPLDVDGIAGAPSCKACPLRTGNDRDTYPDGRADVCTSPECFERKRLCWNQRRKEEAQSQGKLLLYELVQATGDYLPLDSVCPQDLERRTVRELVGEALAGEVVLTEDGARNLRELLPRKSVIAQLRKMGVIKDAPEAAERPRPSLSEEDKQRREDNARANRVQREVADEVLKAAFARGSQLLCDQANGKISPEDGDALAAVLRAATLQLFHHCSLSEVGQLAGRRKMKADPFHERQKLEELIRNQPSWQLFGLLAEMTAARAVLAPAVPDRPLSAALGIDRAKIEGEVRKRAEAKKPPKPGREAKGKATTGGGKR